MDDGSDRIEGKCLCGAVTVRMTPPDHGVEACHCSMCRTWGGGPYLSLKGVTDPEIEGEDNVVRFASSRWAERGFCGRCGTNLFYFYRPKGSYAFAAGLFGGLEGFALDEEIFIDSKPDYYAFAGDHERLTEAEVMAKFGVDDSQ